MQALNRAHLYLTIGIALPVALLHLLLTPSVSAILVPFAGPYCLYLGDTWSNGWGYNDGTHTLKNYLTGLIVLALCIQFLKAHSKAARSIQLLTWGIFWFLWCVSSFIMVLSTLG